MSEPFMVFDVESIGLHGEAFAVGWVIVDDTRMEIGSGLVHCKPEFANGLDKNREWVSQNCPDLKGGISVEVPVQVRDLFWESFTTWKSRGAILVADCGWPVEATFLNKCVEDDPLTREFAGPYPLHELASILFTKDIDPTGKFVRRTNELPEHNPLNDARQSARILMETLYPK